MKTFIRLILNALIGINYLEMYRIVLWHIIIYKYVQLMNQDLRLWSYFFILKYYYNFLNKKSNFILEISTDYS